jgi:ankyrin repeat protein
LQQGADIEARNQLTDEAPLLYMAGRKGSLQGTLIRERAARFLLQKGANMFFTNNRGQKPLVKAAMKGNFGIVRIFLEYLDEECFPLDDIKPLILEAMKTTHRHSARLLSRWYWRRVYPPSSIPEEVTPELELEDDQS